MVTLIIIAVLFSWLWLGFVTAYCRNKERETRQYKYTQKLKTKPIINSNPKHVG